MSSFYRCYAVTFDNSYAIKNTKNVVIKLTAGRNVTINMSHLLWDMKVSAKAEISLLKNLSTNQLELRVVVGQSHDELSRPYNLFLEVAHFNVYIKITVCYCRVHNVKLRLY
jgi:hypothetical protein